MLLSLGGLVVILKKYFTWYVRKKAALNFTYLAPCKITFSRKLI
nr:MAG TPA: hypothetical protein [Caudoviricetes sp.]